MSNNIDKLDISILRYLNEHKEATTTDIAKYIIKTMKLKKTKDNLVKLDNKIRFRLKRFVDSHLILCTKTSPAYYSLNRSKVLFGEGTLTIKNTKGRQFSMDLGEFVVIIGLDGELIVKPLEDTN